MYHTGDFKGPNDPHEIAKKVTPLKVNGMLYLCTPHSIAIALDPDTGKEIWRHDPKINHDASSYQHMVCRGVGTGMSTRAAPRAIRCRRRPAWSARAASSRPPWMRP